MDSVDLHWVRHPRGTSDYQEYGIIDPQMVSFLKELKIIIYDCDKHFVAALVTYLLVRTLAID